jgi:hypothetical protein
LYQQLIRGVKVRPAAQEQANGPGVLGKRKLACTERAGASGSEEGGGGADGTGKQLDGICKSSPPHAAVQRAHQEAAAMGHQMTVSI